MTKCMKAWTIGALVANLMGAILITLSFQATSSDFRLLTMENSTVFRAQAGSTAYAICVNASTLAATDTGGNIAAGTGNCRLWDKGHPAAIVTAEYPNLLLWGLILTCVGFFIQLVMTLRTATASGA